MSKRRDPQFFQVLVRQITQNGKSDVILGEAGARIAQDRAI